MRSPVQIWLSAPPRTVEFSRLCGSFYAQNQSAKKCKKVHKNAVKCSQKCSQKNGRYKPKTCTVRLRVEMRFIIPLSRASSC